MNNQTSKRIQHRRQAQERRVFSVNRGILDTDSGWLPVSSRVVLGYLGDKTPDGGMGMALGNLRDLWDRLFLLRQGKQFGVQYEGCSLRGYNTE